MAKVLTIVMPVYNLWRFTAKSLASILKSSYPKELYEIIVIDNASTDETPALLKHLVKTEPIRVITNKENVGFLLGINQGWKEVETDLMAIICNDAAVRKECLERLVSVINFSPDFGMATGAELNVIEEPLPPLTWFWRGNGDIGNLYQTEVTDQTAPYVECDVMKFACTVIKRKLWETIGFLDERFVPCMYEQEAYCAASLDAGFKNIVVPSAVFWHWGGATTEKRHGHYNRIVNAHRKLFVEIWGDKLRRNEI